MERQPDIEQLVEGTLNPEVIRTVAILVTFPVS